jgi:hypothetical protein
VVKKVIAAVVLIIIAAVSSGCHSGNPKSAASTPAAPATTAPAAPATTAPAAPQTHTAPALTVAENQAVIAAKGYLSAGSGFSKEGLLKQLTSTYGSGFGKAEARFAIKYLNPDWDAQSLIAAKGYLSAGSGFSKEGLLKQLTSTYGSGFTRSQAEYAIKNLHPNWDAQAVIAAKGYLSEGGFSRSSLLQQLTSTYGSGFTQSQAEYAVRKVY